MGYRIASARRREKILSAAARLFWQKGYMATSLEDIAKAANCNKASVYYYFGAKSALLYEIASRAIQELLELASPIVDSELPPAKKVEALVINHLEWQMSHAGVAGIGDTERRNLPPKLLRDYIKMRDGYEQAFRNVIEAGIVKQEFRLVDVKLMSLFVLGFLGSVMRWYRPNGEFTPSEIAPKAYDFIFQGLVRRAVAAESGAAKSDSIK